MRITHKSSISQAEQCLIEHGLGEARLNKLDFYYRCTEEERNQQRIFIHSRHGQLGMAEAL